MIKFFKFLNNARIKYSNAFIICSLVLMIVSLFLESNISFIKTNSNVIIENIILLLDIVFFSNIIYHLKIKSVNKYVLVAIFVICDSFYYVINDVHLSLIFTIALAGIIFLFYKKFSKSSFYISSFIFIVLSILIMTILFNILTYYTFYVADFIKEYPSLFSVIKNISALFFNGKIDNFIFGTGIGVTKIINGNIVKGVKNLFLYNTTNKDIVVSQFLSSDYFVTIFVSIGIILQMYNKIDNKSKLSMIFIVATTIISGNSLLISLFLLLLNPLSYIVYLTVIFVSNLVVSEIDIRIGYNYFPNLIELFKYIEKPIYVLVVGVLLIILSYFLFELVSQKLNANNNFFIDKNARRIIMALGGMKNIVKLDEENILIVKNPNLINILRIDCEIYNNRVVLLENDLMVLKEFL